MNKQLRLRIMVVSLLAIVIGVVFTSYKLLSKKDTSTNSDTPVVNNNDNVKKENQNQYSSYYYYNQENLARYEAYHALNETMDSGDVVWRVNVNIDLEPYQNIITLSGDDMYSKTALINKYFRLPDDFIPVDLVDYGGGMYMTSETYAALTEMQAAASLDNITIIPGSTYRSIEFQAGLYQRYVDSDGQAQADTYSARAGSSEHHTGRAIDFLGPDWSLASFEGTDTSNWMLENAWQYGFILRYPKEYVDVTKYIYEPWHYTYVGKEVSKIMHDEGLETLEEYYVKYIMYQPNT